MRIVIFSDMFPPQINGVATATANFANGLSQQGHQVLVVAPSFGKLDLKFLKKSGIEILRIPAVPAIIYPGLKIALPVLLLIFNKIKKFNPDVIHFQTQMTLGFIAIIMAKLFNKPLVGTIHAYLTSDWIGLKDYGLANRLLSSVALRYCRYFQNMTDLQLAPSHKLIKELKQQGFYKPFAYMPNPITIHKSSPKILRSVQQYKHKYNLTGPVVLHIGRLSYEKRVDLVLRAFVIATKSSAKLDKSHLLIIGEGPARKDLENLASELGISNKVVFTGEYKNNDLVESGLIRVGDLFITASPMENQPMVVLEAMSWGLPIIGVKAAGMIELVQKNGYLVEAGDVVAMAKRISEILTKDAIRLSMASWSLKYAREFAPEKVILRQIASYKRVLKVKASTDITKRPGIREISNVVSRLLRELKEVIND